MRLIIKAKRMPIGTVSHGRKKMAIGRWVSITAEGSGFTKDMIKKLRKEWGKLTTVNPESPIYKNLVTLLESLDANRLRQLAGANIKFVSLLAKIRASKLGRTVGGGTSYARPILQPVFKSILLLPTIVKAKYTRRWKGKDGKWNYEYGKPSERGMVELPDGSGVFVGTVGTTRPKKSKIISRNDLIDSFNKIAKKHSVKDSTLSDLTDHELYIWIAGKTLGYGRSIEDSLNNAKFHMKNRKKAEQLFGIKRTDLLGAG